MTAAMKSLSQLMHFCVRCTEDPYTFRVETDTNALYDVKWSENIDNGEDGNEYKIQVYQRLQWF